MYIKAVILTKRDNYWSRYKKVCLYLNNSYQMCTDSQGKGEPYLETGNDIVFRFNKQYVWRVKLLWPVQSGAYDDNYAAIGEIRLLTN